MEKNRVKRAAPWITRRLRVGLAWLWENKRQRKRALITQQGINSSAGECDLGIIPESHRLMPLVTLEVPCVFAEHGMRLEERLTDDEVEAFIWLLARAAWREGRAQILNSWGGGGHVSASFQMSRLCGKGPAQLLRAHREGCPVPGHQLLCSWDGCTWFADGYNKARLPKGWR